MKDPSYIFLYMKFRKIMNSNNLCYKCNSPIRNNITLCDACRAERNNAAAILATNKKALIKLLNNKTINEDRMFRFDRYVNNIKSKSDIILNYKKLKSNYIYKR